MKTIGEIRRERLLELIAEAGSLKAVGEAIDLSARDSTLSQIKNRSKDSKTGTPREMGRTLARRLEKAFHKPDGWMDTDPVVVEKLAAPKWDRRPMSDDGLLAMPRGEMPRATLLDALDVLGIALAAAPRNTREALALNLAGWAREGGADHWRRAIEELLHDGPPASRKRRRGGKPPPAST